MSNHTVFLAFVAPRSGNPNVNIPGRCIGIFQCPVTAQCVVDAFWRPTPAMTAGRMNWFVKII